MGGACLLSFFRNSLQRPSSRDEGGIRLISVRWPTTREQFQSLKETKTTDHPRATIPAGVKNKHRLVPVVFWKTASFNTDSIPACMQRKPA